MELPPTYYEFVRTRRPTLVEMAEQDAADLLAQENPTEAIHSVDDYDSRFKSFIKRLNAELLGFDADHPGVGMKEMSPHLAGAPPQTKAFIASLYGTVNSEYHCVVNFALASKKTFHFSDNLSEHLANTEINVKAALIQLPFPTCQFTFTSRAVVDAMHNIRGDAGRVAMNTAGLDYAAPVSVFLSMLPAGEGLPGRKLIMCAWHARLPNKSHLALKRELYLHDDWTLEQALRTDWETLTPDDHGIGMSVELDDESVEPQNDDMFYTDGLAFFRIVLNAVLYLSSSDSEVTDKESPRKGIEAKAMAIASRPKRKKLLQTAGRHTALDYQEVGASVGPIVIQKDEADGESRSAGGGKPLVRFMVRGHWRRQACGPENQDRKLIWIKPYYKGDDLARTINKPYLVQ